MLWLSLTPCAPLAGPQLYLYPPYLTSLFCISARCSHRFLHACCTVARCICSVMQNRIVRHLLTFPIQRIWLSRLGPVMYE